MILAVIIVLVFALSVFALGILCGLWLARMFERSPFGVQDREGFHAQLGAEAADAELKLL